MKRSEEIQQAAEKVNYLLSEKESELKNVKKLYSNRINDVCKTHKIQRSNLMKIINAEL